MPFGGTRTARPARPVNPLKNGTHMIGEERENARPGTGVHGAPRTGRCRESVVAGVQLAHKPGGIVDDLLDPAHKDRQVPLVVQQSAVCAKTESIR